MCKLAAFHILTLYGTVQNKVVTFITAPLKEASRNVDVSKNEKNCVYLYCLIKYNTYVMLFIRQ